MTRCVAVAFCLFFLAPTYQAPSCEREALFGVEETFDGVVISTYHPSQPSSHQHSERLTLQGHQLSTECRQHCRSLFKETIRTTTTTTTTTTAAKTGINNNNNQVEKTVVFVPLMGALAVVAAFWDETAHFRLELQATLRTSGVAREADCSPSVTFRIIDGYFTVCTNRSTNFVSVFEVRLNRTSLGSTTITSPINQLVIQTSLGNLTDMSNVLHVEIDFSTEYLLFAVGTVIYYFRPFLHAAGALGNFLPSSSCDRVRLLEHRRETEIYALCSENVFLYDIGDENWLERHTIASRGLPYRCPRPETELSVFPGYIQYQVDGLYENVEVQGESYDSGVCFGNTTQSFFAFRDKSTGVFVVHLEDQEMQSVSSLSCQSECFPLSVVDDRYLVVREESSSGSKAIVLDYLGTRLRLIEVLHVTPVFVTVLVLECPVISTLPLSTTTTTTTTTTTHNNSRTTPTTKALTTSPPSHAPKNDLSHKHKRNVAIIASICTIFLVLVIVVPSCVVLVVALFLFRKKRGHIWGESSVTVSLNVPMESSTEVFPQVETGVPVQEQGEAEPAAKILVPDNLYLYNTT